METPGLMHIGVYTKDIDVSLSFYIDIMGFTLKWRDFVAHPTGRVEAATIVAGGCIIELVKPVDLSRVHTAEGPVQHIALSVNDLEAYIEVISGKGVVLEEPLGYIPFEGGMLHCFVRGPSHERIELAQYSVKRLHDSSL